MEEEQSCVVGSPLPLLVLSVIFVLVLRLKALAHRPVSSPLLFSLLFSPGSSLTSICFWPSWPLFQAESVDGL